MLIFRTFGEQTVNVDLTEADFDILRVAFDSWGAEGYFGFDKHKHPGNNAIIALFEKLFPGQEIYWLSLND